MFETIPQSPVFWAAAAAAVIALMLHYLYGGWLERNYRHIKWLRRLILPHISYYLRSTDNDLDDVDLSQLYVETGVRESEHAMDMPIDEYEDEWDALDDVEKYLKKHYWRPEVILTSLADDPEGRYEIANWVLTAPEKSRKDSLALGRLRELLIMLTAERQLHLRIYYNEEEEKLQFYAHEEYNPYNPLYSKKHFNGVDMNHKGGRQMFLDRFPVVFFNGRRIHD